MKESIAAPASVEHQTGPWTLAFCSVLGVLALATVASIAHTHRQTTRRSARDFRGVQHRFFCDVDGVEDAYDMEEDDDIEDGME